MYYGQIREI
jgi:5S rRNA maturation endonuclease (ribonuclease M5)